MNEMIDRMTRAFWTAALPGWAPHATSVLLSHRQLEAGLRAVIEALRNPPREMLDEVIRQLGDSSTFTHWDTMLDEILK